jgi:hypothetical protein
MKFKTMVELIEEFGPKKGDDDQTWDIREYGEQCIAKAFESFAERVEFYKKYKNRILKLVEDYPEYRGILDIYIIEGAPVPVTQHMIASRDFNNWLFNHCFGDMTK